MDEPFPGGYITAVKSLKLNCSSYDRFHFLPPNIADRSKARAFVFSFLL